MNPSDPCVANKTVNGAQHTTTWHVDDLKSSHKDSKVNDDFIKWIKDQCGKIGDIKAVQGQIQDYLAMKLNYSKKGQFKVDMTEYVKSMIQDYPESIGDKKAAAPASGCRTWHHRSTQLLHFESAPAAIPFWETNSYQQSEGLE